MLALFDKLFDHLPHVDDVETFSDGTACSINAWMPQLVMDVVDDESREMAVLRQYDGMNLVVGKVDRLLKSSPKAKQSVVISVDDNVTKHASFVESACAVLFDVDEVVLKVRSLNLSQKEDQCEIEFMNICVLWRFRLDNSSDKLVGVDSQSVTCEASASTFIRLWLSSRRLSSDGHEFGGNALLKLSRQR